MAAIKTTWGKPEMTVLVRDRPEEAVLAACKFGRPAAWAECGEGEL